MKTEIEVKFVDVDVDEIRGRLKKAGAHLECPMRLLRRRVFYTVDRNPDAFIRVRDEGDKATMTYKRFEGDGIYAAKEAEVVVNDFQTTIEALEGAGLLSKSYQESRRETWRIGTAEIMIDEWPWAPPFIEIEGESEKDVRNIAEKIGFDWKKAIFGGVASVYRPLYPAIRNDLVVNNYPAYLFGDPVPKEFLGK